MASPDLLAVVVGNVALDILCYPVGVVPRRQSLQLEQALLGPGGCGSNTAIGLAALGVPTRLLTCIGDDEGGRIAESYWRQIGVDTGLVIRQPGVPTGVTVGLIDHQAQPRFLYAPGANQYLHIEHIQVEDLAASARGALHIGGFFLLPQLMDPRLAESLRRSRERGWHVTLDVAMSPNMAQPESLWACLPALDVFLCNLPEARTLTGCRTPAEAADALHRRGAHSVIIKLGRRGCWLDAPGWQGILPAPRLPVVDTTGAGDAFAAGLIAACLRGADLPEACRQANQAGARMVGVRGAVAGWFTSDELPNSAQEHDL